MLSRFHRPPELPLQLLKPSIDHALGLPPGQALSWIAGLRTEGISGLQQGPQPVSPEPSPVWGVPLRQTAGEGRLLPGAAAIGSQQQHGSQAQQQGEAGTDEHVAFTHCGRR